MLILEAVRQASIATSHLSGFPDEGALTLAAYDMRFFSFANKGVPVTIRTFTSQFSCEGARDQNVAFIADVFQWGKPVADASIGAFAFGHRPAYTRQRERSSRIAERNRRLFHDSLYGMAVKEVRS
ncbi:hypothetical protein JCM17961_15640 [Endothiovibrio diazotrophicus]